MPTRNPRVNICVTDAQHRMLMELGKLQGRSAASIVREMLDASTEMLGALLPIYRAAAQEQAMQPERLKQAIKDVLAGVESNRSQLDLLALLADAKPALANDQEGPDAVRSAPSAAREDGGAPVSRKRTRRA